MELSRWWRTGAAVAGSTIRSRLASSHLLAGLALLVAISGGSAVALQGRNSVDSGDIRNGTVRGVDVRNNTIQGADVSERTLDCGAIPGCGQAGPPGPPGPQGPTGPPGPRGSSGSGGDDSAEPISYGIVYSDEEQLIPPGAAVTFNNVGPTKGVSLSGATTIVVRRGGVYSIDARALASSGPGLALALEVNDTLTRARSGGGIAATGPVVLDHLLELPAGAHLRVVNVGDSPGTLTNNVANATVNSAEVNLHSLGSS